MFNHTNKTKDENNCFASISMLALPIDDNNDHDDGGNKNNQDEIDDDNDPDWKELATLIIQDEDITMDDLLLFEEGLKEWATRHKKLTGKSLFGEKG